LSRLLLRFGGANTLCGGYTFDEKWPSLGLAEERSEKPKRFATLLDI